MSTNLRYLDNFQLRELLGRGGMAEVWKAYDTRLQRYVAIKLLHADLQDDPDFLNRFMREARFIASLHHPNIVQVYGFETTISPESANPLAYMIIEYIEGRTLAEYIRHTSREGRFPSGVDLVQLFACLSRAIDYAHSRGMVHRDIKPANIMLDRHNTTHLAHGEPILTDFGIARLLGGSTGTLSHTWLGTPLYLSPEQAQGQPGTALSDIYSLGVILYEMCTGALPFHGETIPAIILQQVSAQPPLPEQLNPQVTPALSKVIMCCLAKDPAQRFQNAAAMTVALAEALNQPVPADLSQTAARREDSGGDSIYEPTLPCLWQKPSPPSAQQPESLPQAARSPVSPPAAQTPPAYSATPVVPSFSTPSRPLEGPPVQNATNPFVTGEPVRITPAEASPQTPAQSPPQKGLVHRPQPPAFWSRLFADKKRRPLWLALLAALALLVLISSVGGIYWLTHRGGTVAGAQSVGQVFFANSGAVSEHNNTGENDEVIVDLHNLQAPASGNAYYAWLLSGQSTSENAPILLGKITANNGSAHLQYADPNHTNLLALASRFLITEETLNPAPIAPTLDRTAWRYYAEIPQTPNPQSPEHFSLLDHLRHLLSQDPKLYKLQLPGGLDIWLFRNTEKVLEWSGSARDFWEQKNTEGMRNMVVRVLDYLDGSQYVQLDVPPGTPNLVNPRIAPVALLEFDPTKQAPPGYLYHIDLHLNGVVNSPGATPEQSHLAIQISNDLNNVKGWLQQVRQDAKQLVTMPAQNLLSNNALTLLDNMETNARYAYVGKLDPSSNRVEGGVTQVYYSSQALATMNVAPYSEG
jgi:serine/threonine protein kinase